MKDQTQTNTTTKTNSHEDKIAKLPIYTIGEEIFNSVTHGIGALIAIAGLVIMVIFAANTGDPYKIVSSVIYGSTMIILYSMSCLYHGITNKNAKTVFRIFDHCSIFLLIAGTYTPYTLISLRGGLGWTLFGIVWAVAILGIVLNAVNLEKFKKFSLICYIVMGWVIVIAMKPLLNALALPGFLLLAAGGLAYTGGVVFYVKDNCPYMHGIWHLFVLLGTILHFFSILFYAIL